MKLPKRGVPPEKLKCKICGKLAADQPNNIQECAEDLCPYKGAVAGDGETS